VSPEYQGVEPNVKYADLQEQHRKHMEAFRLMSSVADDPESGAMVEIRTRTRELETRMTLVAFP
jgi:uncharacterized protein YbjQ (UPF0145 family)